MSWIGRKFSVTPSAKIVVISLLLSITLIHAVYTAFGLKVYFPGKIYGKGVWYRFKWVPSKISCFGMSCFWIINEKCLWNVSFSSSKDCSLGLILLVVLFLLDHSIDFNTLLSQPSVSIMWPPRPFSFDEKSALITPVPIAITIFLEIPPPTIRTPVATSFTFTRNSSATRFGLPCLLCTVELLLFCSFSICFF